MYIFSKYLVSLKEGDSVELKGPFKKYPYVPNTLDHIGMLAGGSGKHKKERKYLYYICI